MRNHVTGCICAHRHKSGEWFDLTDNPKLGSTQDYINFNNEGEIRVAGYSRPKFYQFTGQGASIPDELHQGKPKVQSYGTRQSQ